MKSSATLLVIALLLVSSFDVQAVVMVDNIDASASIIRVGGTTTTSSYDEATQRALAELTFEYPTMVGWSSLPTATFVPGTNTVSSVSSFSGDAITTSPSWAGEIETMFELSADITNETSCDLAFRFLVTSPFIPDEAEGPIRSLTGSVGTDSETVDPGEEALFVSGTIPSGDTEAFSFSSHIQDLGVDADGFVYQYSSWTLEFSLPRGETCTCSVPEPSACMYLGLLVLGMFNYRRSKFLQSV